MQPSTPTPLKHFGPLKGGWGVGGSRAGVPGTPPHIPQNDPLVALIIWNTHMWGGFELYPLGGPSSQVWGAGWGRSGVRKMFHVLHTYLAGIVLNLRGPLPTAMTSPIPSPATSPCPFHWRDFLLPTHCAHLQPHFCHVVGTGDERGEVGGRVDPRRIFNLCPT